MQDQSFAVTEASTWRARGRSATEAEALARAWRDFPDLSPDAPLADRMARTRRRVQAMRPIIEATERRTEQERQARNFAFVAAKLARGEADGRDRAILRGRDHHDQDWDGAVRYADGWYAATVGWPYRPPASLRAARAEADRTAYDLGFRDGGGEPADLFDAARRSFAATAASAPIVKTTASRPLPSTWPKPSDAARPTPWRRRLAIVSEYDPALETAVRAPTTRSAALIAEIRRRSADAATVILLLAELGFIPAAAATQSPRALTAERVDQLIGDPAQRDRLRALLARAEYDDLLVAAQGGHLRVIDAFADTLPLCRCMERTRNTPMQQRAHVQVWLDRAAIDGGNTGAGHIRWSKLAKGLTGKLGEFTVRYAGKGEDRLHRIAIELADGAPADGYAAADGRLLEPEVRFTNKAQLRAEMAAALRRFGGATRLSAASALPSAH